VSNTAAAILAEGTKRPGSPGAFFLPWKLQRLTILVRFNPNAPVYIIEMMRMGTT
jgi:hypothetical protein